MDLVSIIGDHAYTQVAMNLLSTHPYIFIFGGLIIGGETILLPVIYFSLLGQFNLEYVLALMVIATTVSDTIWFFIGRGLARGVKFVNVKNGIKKKMLRLSKVFDAHSERILFASKFVYGTRIAVQVLAGAHNMKFMRYFLINLLGIFALMVFYVLGIKLFASSASAFDGLKYGFHLVFALTMIGVLVINGIISLIVKRKWFRS